MYLDWHLYQLNDESGAGWPPSRGHLYLLCPLLKHCEPQDRVGQGALPQLEWRGVTAHSSGRIPGLINCDEHRLIGFTSCCHMLREINLQPSSLNSLISLNTICLCLQNVISQWALRTIARQQIFIYVCIYLCGGEWYHFVALICCFHLLFPIGLLH